MKLRKIPKASPIDHAIAGLQKARDAIDLQIRELRAQDRQAPGQVEPVRNPFTGGTFLTKKKYGAKK